MCKKDELRCLIVRLLERIEDGEKLKRIYDFVNQVFCKD